MQPQSPDPKFDFMLKDQPQQRRRLVPNLPRPALITLVAVGGIILLIVIYSVLTSGSKGSTQSFVGVAARAQETLRITALAQQQNFQDSQTQALAATVTAALGSDEQQIIQYLASNHTKPTKAQLASVIDKTSDASIETAAQNNNLDTAYVDYLRGALAHYETDLSNAYKTAGPKGKALLLSTSESTRTLLNSPPLKT